MPADSTARTAAVTPVAAHDALAATWADAVQRTSYLPMSSREVVAFLRAQVDTLVRLLDVEPPATDDAQALGTGLVEAHLTSPEGLEATIVVLMAAPETVSRRKQLGDRWARLVAALAAGYARALRARVLREQQEMLDAALTARERAEEAQWSAETQLERARTDFITTVSHELRTPLTPIKGYLHVLLARDEEIGPDQRAEFYQVMLSQADLLNHLLDDLLSGVARSTDAEFRVTPTTVDVVRVVRRALQDVDPTTTREFRWLGPDDVGQARCDPLRLRQVLGNLLRNADLYATPGQTVEVSGRRDDDTVEIVVRDYGPGIPADQAHEVFEPFRRLEHGPTPGTGLGLHIARRLVEAMSGRIWHTDASPGSAFHVTVPAA